MFLVILNSIGSKNCACIDIPNDNYNDTVIEKKDGNNTEAREVLKVENHKIEEFISKLEKHNNFKIHT